MVYSKWINATSTTACTTDSTWQYWVSDSGTTATTASNQIWVTWTTAVINRSASSQCDTQRYYSEEDIKELNRIEAEKQEKYARAQKEISEKQKKIEETARQLLREVLNDEQNKQFDEKGYFELTSVTSGNIYRINKGRSRNVELLNKDRNPIQRLCFHPEERVHNYDTMVAQKLMLELYEDDVKKVANYS